MTTREKYIAEGIITEAVCAYPGYPVRQTLIEKGYIRPHGLFVEPNAPMSRVMREFLIRVTGR